MSLNICATACGMRPAASVPQTSQQPIHTKHLGSTSASARRARFVCRAAAAESVDETEQDQDEIKVVKAKRFMDAMRDNQAKKDTRNWEAMEIAAAMDPLAGGIAPELIQGRLAMLAWLGVGFAEKATGMTAAGQYAEFSTIINSLAFIISLATLMPTLVTANPLADIVASTKTGMPEAWVKINGNTEEMVGRSAMVGFAFLLLTEAALGRALFA